MDSCNLKFKSTAHKLISYMRENLSELIYTPITNNDEIDTEIIYEGEKDYYHFTKDLYEDMNNNIVQYNIPHSEYDKFMGGRTKSELSEKEAKKESKLRNEFKQAIKIYPRFLYEIGIRGIIDEVACQLILERQHFEKAMKQVRRHLSQMKGEEMKRISVLSRLGLVIEERKEKIIMTNLKYPSMFVGLSALCNSDNKKFHFTNFLRCDYRGLNKFYKPGIQEVIKIVPEGYKHIIQEVDAWMKEKRAKTEVRTMHYQPVLIPWKVNYSIKGKSAVGLQADFENLSLYAYFNNYKNIMLVASELSKVSEEFCSWFNDLIPGSNCNCKNNRRIEIGGMKKRICGLMNRMDINNPDKDNLARMKTIVGLYQDNIRLTLKQE